MLNSSGSKQEPNNKDDRIQMTSTDNLNNAKFSSYDNFSMDDTSSQYSVDIVEVAARGLDIEDGPLSRPSLRGQQYLQQPDRQLGGNEVLLNASRLRVESDKNV